MGPILQSIHRLSDVMDTTNDQPQHLTTSVAGGREWVVVASYERLCRLDLEANVWEAFPGEGAFRYITSIAAAPDGGCYLGDIGKIHRLDHRMSIVKSTPLRKKAGVKRMAAASKGFIGLLAWKGGRYISGISHTNSYHVLVRYSDELEKMWHIVLPGEPNPCVPLVARGTERFYVAAQVERLSLLEIQGHLQAFRVHDIPEMRRRYHTYDWPFDDEYEASHEEEKRIGWTTHGIWDACSHPEDDIVTLSERVDAQGEVATRLYRCRFDASLSGFRTYSHFLEGRFFRIASLPNRRIAALGRITSEGDGWVVAIFQLPTIRSCD